MKRYFKFILPLAAIMLMASCTTAQPFPRNSRDDDRYNDRRYEDDRYGNVLGNNRYGSGWYNLKDVRVANRNSSERLHLSARDGRNIRQLLFRTDGAVDIYRVTVRYRNGRTEDLNLPNNRYNNNRRNNRNWNDDLMVTIPGRGNADIRQLTFWYSSANRSPFAGRPTVSVFAR